jgi:hypothetical protein
MPVTYDLETLSADELSMLSPDQFSTMLVGETVETVEANKLDRGFARAGLVKGSRFKNALVNASYDGGDADVEELRSGLVSDGRLKSGMTNAQGQPKRTLMR